MFLGGASTKISSKFSNLENWWFSLKITQLCREPQERGFVAQSSWGHHSKGFCPYFQVFKLKSTPELSACSCHTIYTSKKYDFNFDSPISVYSQTTKEILHKNVFDCTYVIFFENSRKSWVSEKKSTFESDAHSAVWLRSQLLQLGTGFRKKKASFKTLSFYDHSGPFYANS